MAISGSDRMQELPFLIVKQNGISLMEVKVACHTKMLPESGLVPTVKDGLAPPWVPYCGITESGNTSTQNGGCLMIVSMQSLFKMIVQLS